MTLIFAELTKRRKMTIVRLTNREKAMFLNLAFRDELRFTASVIAGGMQLPLYIRSKGIKERRGKVARFLLHSG